MEAKRFILESICGNNPHNRGFFVHLEQKNCCHHCGDTFYVMHPTTNGRFWCGMCYVKTYCTITHSDEGFIIRNKNSSKILFQSFPIIEKTNNVNTNANNQEIPVS